MSNIQTEAREQLNDLRQTIKDRLDVVKKEADQDLEINDLDLDESLLDIPKKHSKWVSYLTDETINLKELYSLKERVKLERWKYYTGKQTDEYVAKNGILHEKILKSDVDKYLSADEKLVLINDVVSVQKALVEYIERTLKEIGNRGFHIKSIIEWRKFTSGG